MDSGEVIFFRQEINQSDEPISHWQVSVTADGSQMSQQLVKGDAPVVGFAANAGAAVTLHMTPFHLGVPGTTVTREFVATDSPSVENHSLFGDLVVTRKHRLIGA